MTQISLATDVEHKLWDDYVLSHTRGTFCHLYGWKRVIVASCGFKPFYLKAIGDQGDLVGVLPLFEQKSTLFGHILVSTPFCMYGGALANSPEIHELLEKEAVRIAEELHVDYLELRSKFAISHTNLIEKSVHSYFVKPLSDSEEQVLLDIKKKQRAVVRHSLKNGLTARVDKDVDTLYDIYAISVRNLGTPVFPKSLFTNLTKEFGNDVDILTVEHDKKAISSVMNFYFNGMAMPYYGGGLSDARAFKSNDFMYYNLMLHAVKRGCASFDFGRSKNNSGPYKYKASWGIEPTPIYHYYHLVKARELPNLSPTNPKYELMINVWKKLPVGLSKLVGPLLSKYLG